MPLLEEAWEARNWDIVLAILRRGPDFLGADQLAALRGYCWQEMCHPEVAALFFDFALRQRPDEPLDFLAALEPLVALGKLDDVKERVQSSKAITGTWFQRCIVAPPAVPPAAVA